MMPPYRFMDSYPNQQDQMPWIRYQYPSYGAFQPQMKMDASRPPFMYESWPHSNYCSSSVPFHGCCNHNNFPGYYNFRPPCPHVSLIPGQEPKVWNGWFPIDANGLKLQEKDVKRNQDQQKEEKMSQLPIPIVWMPSSNKQEEVEKHDNNATNAASKTAEEMPNFRFIPVNLPHYDDSTNKLKAGEEKCDSQASQTVANRQSSSSSPKASKLPPICLRVDPLPRKKNGNGSSRSPSPPGTKERVEDTGKDSISSEIKENFLHEKQAKDDSLKQIKEVEPVTKEIENIEVANTRSINKDGELGHRPQAQIPVNLPIGSLDEISMESTGVSKEKGDDECREGGAGHAQAMTADKTILTEKVADLQASGGGECKPKKKLSDVEAAVLIQSAYRGFQVRRWEPIKKLKQMDKVQEQMAEVKSRIQALESSSDLTKDDRQRVVIGEMIMNLLLKLDTIQGLHPSLRDIRKGLANELVSLQVQLDALMMKKSRESTEEAFTVVPANNHVVEMQSDVSMENKEAAGFGRDQRENYCDRSENMKEKEQGQNLLLHKTDAVSDSRDKEVANTESYDEEKHRTHDNEVQEIPVHSGIECQAAEQTAIVGSPDDTGHGGSEDTQQAMTVNPEGFDMPTCVEHSVQQLKATDGKTGSEDDMPTADDYQEVKEPKDFPQALISEESGVSAAERNEKVQSDLSENLTKRARDDDLMLNNNEAGQNLLAGLP